MSETRGRPDLRLVPPNATSAPVRGEPHPKRAKHTSTKGKGTKRPRGVERARYFGFGAGRHGHPMLLANNAKGKLVAQLYLQGGDSEDVIKAATEHMRAILDLIDPPKDAEGAK